MAPMSDEEERALRRVAQCADHLSRDRKARRERRFGDACFSDDLNENALENALAAWHLVRAR